MNPFNFGWYSNNPNNVNLVYLDGEPIEPAYPGSTNYSMTIPDNGVVKIFLAEEPVKCNVAFTVEDGIDATVTQDIVKTVADWRAGIECFKGTKVAVSGEGIEVSVGGTSLPRIPKATMSSPWKSRPPASISQKTPAPASAQSKPTTRQTMRSIRLWASAWGHAPQWETLPPAFT